MAARKEKSKEAKIKSEKTRLKGIFKDLDENKKKLVTPLIEKAAFMSDRKSTRLNSSHT